MSGSDDIGSEAKLPFYTQTAILDAYLRSPDPGGDPIALDVIIQTLRESADLRGYFFRSGPHPAWAAVLWEKGFFRTPPPPQQTENGLVRFRWDEQEYLISVAGRVPDIAIKHFAALKDDPEYGSRAIYALQSVPAESVEHALPQLLQWLRDPRVGRITAAATYELAVKLAEKKQTVIAFELFRAALAPQPPLKAQRIEGTFFGTEAVLLFDLDRINYSTDEKVRFKNALNLFGSIDVRQTMSVFEDHLLNALRLEGEAKGIPDYEQNSWWRTAIEDSDQDIRDEYKDKLLIALRDTLCSWVERDPRGVEQLVLRYLRNKIEILKRLGLHILTRFPHAYRKHVARELLDIENLNDAGIHHEYFLLLREGYSHLDEQEQQSLLALIGQGPPKETVERVADWAHKEHGVSREEYIQGYSKQWILKRLWMLKEHLSGETAHLLEELVAESGEPEHAEYTHWMSGAYTVADVSPLSHEQLYLMPPDVLVDFLREWQPQPQQILGPEQITRGALGQAAAEVIFSDFDRYATYLKTIALIGPAIAVPVIGGFTADKRSGGVRWREALDLCEALLEDPNVRHSLDNTDENWRGARQMMVSLLEAAVEKPKGEGNDIRVSPELLPRVRDLLLQLLDDPDPRPESDRPPEDFVGHNDPATVALNHVRPRAMLALIQYSVHRALLEKEEAGNDVASNAAISRLEPEVREALTRKLNPREESSSAVHCIYGWSLYRLRWLDQDWLESYLDAIFPEGNDPATAWMFVAAWDAYVAFNRNTFVRPFFEKLRPKYERAIDNLARGLVTRTHLEPSRGLASHLLWEYLKSNYQLRSSEGENSLLVHFFKKAPLEDRGGASWLLWRICHDNPRHLSEIWPRVRQFWEWRVDESARANHPNDFDREMEWYARLPLEVFELETIKSIWALLEGTLPHIVRFEHHGIGWDSLEEYLAKEVLRDPLRTIQFYHLMHKRLSHTAWLYHKDESRTIIETAAAHESSRQEALALIDTLARSGNHQYRDIYQQYAR